MADTVGWLEDESAGLQLYLAKFLARVAAEASQGRLEWERPNGVWQLLQAMVRVQLPQEGHAG